MNQTSEQLLADFARSGAEEAFHELVQRHLPLVYSTALRVTNSDKHLAEDVAQMVFSDLARKAGSISSGTVLAGWLYQHTWFTASKMIRTERRRQMREETTMGMQSSTTTNAADETELQAALDEELTNLKPEDRDAVVLRYFEKVDLRRIGALFGISEDAAQKRVARAVEKLRDAFAARGMTVSTAGLIAFLSSQGLAAPPALASVVTSGALVAASGTAVGVTTFLASTKGKLAVMAACAIAAGTPVLWQQQKMGALNAEIARMSAVAGSNEVLRSEIERLRGETLSAAEREEMNRRFLELQRLRGEVTLLRKQAADAAALASKSGSDVKEEETTEAQEVAQVLLETRVAEMSPERMAALLKSGFPPVADPNNFNLKLSRETAAAALRLLEESEGVDLLAAPKVTTLDGREARVSVAGEPLDGGFLSPGLEVGFIPTVLPDKESIHLKIDVKNAEFVGWGNEANPVPRFRVRSVEHQETLGPGECALLGRPALLGEGESREMKVQVYWFSSHIIDAAGNVVAAKGK